ncbi:protein of unknown function DUF1555 [Desulfonatronospira thiodismutans ASO3-1]|uniref:PEP-CTERM protein-sorting domain-containing protein n=1 Tax=Desulfonatronospira thiodismutans ASO3-1 TaxID=555779 RepID=D6SKV9_9BACT|nr:protein of unknown function DUF1555 [Desulfonatronospira thiodismutans ASO3-1]
MVSILKKVTTGWVLGIFCVFLFPLAVHAGKINFYQLGVSGGASPYYQGVLSEDLTLTITNNKEGSLLSHFYFYGLGDIKVADVDGFKNPATPGFLPGLYSPPVTPDRSFGFSSPAYRVAAGDQIAFALSDGNYEDVFSLIRNNDLIIGLFVQDFDGSESAQFASVPLPASVVLLFSGLAGLVFFRRFKKDEQP